MNGYDSQLSILKGIRPLDDNAVSAHKVARLKIAHLAGKEPVSRGINYKVVSLEAKRTAPAYNVLVSVSVFRDVFYSLTVERSCALQPESIAIGILILSEKF